MSHVENAEYNKDGSGRTSDTVTNECVEIDARVATKTSQILEDALDKREESENVTKCDDTKSQDEKNDGCISSSDICRICHMDGCDSVTDSQTTIEQQNRNLTLSNYAHLSPLISACRCRGTVALVHVECLERWLTESGRERCELCGYRYATKRVLRYNLFRSVVIWLQTVIATRQMLLDMGYLMMTTPVAAFSCYVCALALRMLLRNGLYEIPWMIVAMLPTCLLTLIAYWRWIITLGRLHGHRWRRYWRHNFVIRLIPDNENNIALIDTINHRSTERARPQEEFEDRAIEETEEFS